MEVLQTHIDTKSDEFKANREAMEEFDLQPNLRIHRLLEVPVQRRKDAAQLRGCAQGPQPGQARPAAGR